MPGIIYTMNFYSCTVSAFEQYALAAFMENGYFERHIHRMKKYYKTKRDNMLGVFENSRLRKYAVIDEKDSGSHFLICLDTTLSDSELKWKVHGIYLDCLSEYCEAGKEQKLPDIQDRSKPAIMIQICSCLLMLSTIYFYGICGKSRKCLLDFD